MNGDCNVHLASWVRKLSTRKQMEEINLSVIWKNTLWSEFIEKNPQNKILKFPVFGGPVDFWRKFYGTVGFGVYRNQCKRIRDEDSFFLRNRKIKLKNILEKNYEKSQFSIEILIKKFQNFLHFWSKLQIFARRSLNFSYLM